ncbi:hypothetical protein ACFWN2_04260 [Lentzea sp. NPDC058436]|uniref:hypothetical protein n=1 Tax=Lentzea sp. NPDC058436 TaxID=3346499 RepID=UPI0036640320
MNGPLPQPEWPIIVISAENTFLHLGRDLRGLQNHMYEDAVVARNWDEKRAARVRPVTLEFFDSDGKVLEPMPLRGWVPTGFRFAERGEAVRPSELLERMATIVQDAHTSQIALQISALGEVTPSEQQRLELTYAVPSPADGDTVATFATTLLNHPAYAGRPRGPADPGDTGGWMHNLMHATFG